MRTCLQVLNTYIGLVLFHETSTLRNLLLVEMYSTLGTPFVHAIGIPQNYSSQVLFNSMQNPFRNNCAGWPDVSLVIMRIISPVSLSVWVLSTCFQYQECIYEVSLAFISCWLPTCGLSVDCSNMSCSVLCVSYFVRPNVHQYIATTGRWAVEMVLQ